MPFAGEPTIFDIDPYATSTVAQHQFGAKGIDKYGDVYRYCKVGASNISAGKLQVAPAPKTNHHNCAVVTATKIGDNLVTLTLGATALVAGEYEGGKLCFNDNAPEGASYRIIKSPAADSAGTAYITVDRPFVTVTTTSSEATLVHNTWNGVVEAAVEERRPAGVPLIDMTAGTYGWLMTHGTTAGLAGGAISLGASVTPHASTAGAFQEAQQFLQATDASRSDFYWIVGRAPVAGVDTEYRPITLCID